jgi:hypothetical protein
LSDPAKHLVDSANLAKPGEGGVNGGPPLFMMKPSISLPVLGQMKDQGVHKNKLRLSE